MSSGKVGLIKTAALVIGAMIAVWAALRASDGGSDPAFLLFLLWIVSPYLVLLVITWPVERFTEIPGRYGIGCVVAILMLGFSLLAYVGTAGDRSSTYGLIFIFVPFWLHIGGPGLYGICVLVSWLTEWSQRRAAS